MARPIGSAGAEIVQGQDTIIIIGAGLIGLTIAQACRKHNVPYLIFERDPNADYGGAGYGITFHWALPILTELLPQDTVEELAQTYVDPDAVARGEKGNFIFFNLQSGQAKWKVPPSDRIRCSRQKLRKLLMKCVDVQWSKDLRNIGNSDNGVTVYFEDGTSASGRVLLGCDGARSRTRQLLCPDHNRTQPLPVRMLGVAYAYPVQKSLEMRALDIYSLFGADPRTSAFLWFSFLDTPTNNDREPGASDSYMCNIMISWPYRPGFWGKEEAVEVPKSPAARLSWMKEISKEWADPFRSIVQDLPPNIEPKRISTEDWVPGLRGTTWDGFKGRATLVGDAAHPMTMYRGEAANHGMRDIQVLLEQLLPLYDTTREDGPILQSAINAYEDEMCKRTKLAVLASRQACLDAHQYERINETSPLIARRLPSVD